MHSVGEVGVDAVGAAGVGVVDVMVDELVLFGEEVGWIEVAEVLAQGACDGSADGGFGLLFFAPVED